MKKNTTKTTTSRKPFASPALGAPYEGVPFVDSMTHKTPKGAKSPYNQFVFKIRGEVPCGKENKK